MDLNKTSTTASHSYSESAFLIEKNRKQEDLLVRGTRLGSLKFRLLILTFFLLLGAICVSLGVTLGIVLTKDSETSHVRSFPKAAVATDAKACSEVGVDILQKGGSAVDAAVAASFCVGVVNLQSTGIGGGGFMVYYNATNKSSIMIDFREVAASNITEETLKKYREDDTSTTLGGLSVMVPGQIRGLHEAWQRHGRLTWEELLEPSISLARDGFKVTKPIAEAIKAVESTLKDDRFKELRSILIKNEKPLEEGDIIKQTNLSETLKQVASNGPDYFYNSTLTSKMVEELQDDGSVLTVSDFQNYEVKIRETVITEYEEYSVHGTSLPGGGAVMGLIFNILDGYNITSESFKNDELLTYHHVIEAFKFAYGQRLHLGDADFNETVKQVFDYMLDPSTAEDMRSMITDDTTHDPSYYMRDEMVFNPFPHGTSHLSVYAENGDAVATTHSINTYFGSKLRSTSGVLFNNDIDDFSVPGRNNSFGYPPSPANYIRPKHRALSSMSPTIVLKNGKVVMVAGASGGSIIPTAVSQIILDVLSFGQDLQTASPYPRLHDQLLPNVLLYEPEFPQDIVSGLKSKNHIAMESTAAAIVQAIYIDEDGTVNAASDYRKGGVPDGY